MEDEIRRTPILDSCRF